MRRFLDRFVEFLAERKYRARCDTALGPGVLIKFRNLGNLPPTKLVIGEGTIFQGHISADRSEAIVSIGKNTFIGNSHLVCAERIEIGNDVLISWGCTISDHDSHSLSWEKRKHDVKQTHLNRKDWAAVAIQPVIVRDRAWIGFNSIILKGVVIGEGAVVGAGSVVTRDVSPYSVVGGNPARFIKNCDDL